MNNPVNYVDPNGHNPLLLVLGFAIGFGIISSPDASFKESVQNGVNTALLVYGAYEASAFFIPGHFINKQRIINSASDVRNSGAWC
jgi:hypothetical protein